MSRNGLVSSLRTIIGVAFLLPMLVLPAAQAMQTDNGVTDAPPVVTCGGTVYTRVLYAVDSASGSYFALYADPTGNLAIRWKLDSEKVATSDSATGITIEPGLGGASSTFLMPDLGQFNPGPSGRVSFSTTDVSFYGSCAHRIGHLTPNVEYSGRLEGLVLEIEQQVYVDCQAISQTKVSGGFLWLFIVGFGWYKAQSVVRIVCVEDTSITMTPDWIFRGKFVASYVPGVGTMVCLDAEGTGLPSCVATGAA